MNCTNKNHLIPLFATLALALTAPFVNAQAQQLSWNDRMEDWLTLKGFLEK